VADVHFQSVNRVEKNLVNRPLVSFSVHRNNAEETWQMFICRQNDAEEKPRQKRDVKDV